jgi:raffinose/stachyose/melibiose transport system substrate-binding protein
MSVLSKPLPRRSFLKTTSAFAVLTVLSRTRSFADAPTQLVFWTENVEGYASEPAESNFLKQYTKSHPQITFSRRLIASQDFNKQFKAAVAAGEPYDVVEVNVQFFRDYIYNGLLEDLTPALTSTLKADFLPMATEQLHLFAMKDAVFGIPTQLATTGIYYNKKIFDTHNLQIPATWDDVRGIAKKLDGTGIAAFVYAGAEPWWNPMWFNAFFFQRTKNDGIAVNEAVMKGQASFDSEPYIQAIQDVVDLDKQGIMIKGSQGIDMATADSIFQRGQAAMIFMGTWYDTGLKRAKFTDYGVFPFPVLDHTVKSQAPGSIGELYSVGANSQHKSEAIKIIQQMAGPDFQKAVLSTPGAGLPLLKSLQGTNQDPVIQSFEKIAPSTVVWLDALWEPEIISAVQNGVQTAIVGSGTPKQVAASIAEKYKQLREDGRTFYK